MHCFSTGCLLCCSEFQQLKVLQSSLPAVAQTEADACKSLIDAFNAWFAANCTSQAGMLEGVTQVSSLSICCDTMWLSMRCTGHIRTS